MKNAEFTDKLRRAAEGYKTLYIKGCFGAPMTAKNKKRYSNNNAYNRGRADMINAASADTFGFDCVCLVKGILWGWRGDGTKNYGGASYASGGVPDIGTETIIKRCADVSEDFGDIVPGELLHMPGHVGVYIGGGLAVECTPAWKNGVQITAVGNIGKVAGYKTRRWERHGKLPWVDYTDAEDSSPNVKNPSEPSDEDEAGNGERVYVVKKGDSLWAIARRELGAGRRYTEIKKLNGLKSNLIVPGQVLRLPNK